MKKNSAVALIIAYIKIAVGAACYAAGFQLFLYDNAIASGGVSGIAMTVNYLTGLPVGMLIIAINIPIFLFAWKKYGTKFLIASLFGMVFSSLLVDLFATLSISITSEIFLASVYGGILTGFGLGLVYSAGGTTGGVDIIAKFLRSRYPFINLGTLILSLDVVVILIFAILFKKYDNSLYAIIAMFLASKVIDLVLYGASNSKLCYIIADKHDEIKTAIVNKMERGATLLKGEGAYTGREKQIILCAIKPQQIVKLRRLVNEYDEDAFVIVCDSREVFGNGFSSIADFD